MTRLVCLSLVVALPGFVPTLPDLPRRDPQKYLTNSIGMKFVWIPPGSFMMGSPEGRKRKVRQRNPAQGHADQGLLHGRYTRDPGTMARGHGQQSQQVQGRKEPAGGNGFLG